MTGTASGAGNKKNKKKSQSSGDGRRTRPPHSNPIHYTFTDPPVTIPPISSRDVVIAGIRTTVYGLEELPASTGRVSVLWLLHPRLERSRTMAPLAAWIVNAWNHGGGGGGGGSGEGSSSSSSSPSSQSQTDDTEKKKKKTTTTTTTKKRRNEEIGLIAASISLRNHGSRTEDPNANEVWRTGNPNHARDMFSICHGTTLDLTLLMTHLASYIFPHQVQVQGSAAAATTTTTTTDANGKVILSHQCLGVSLGGHTAWQVLVHDRRVRSVIVIVGGADYVRLLTDRARLSKIKDYVDSDPPGSRFLGSESFSGTLVQAVREVDAAQRIMGPRFYADPETVSPSSPSPPPFPPPPRRRPQPAEGSDDDDDDDETEKSRERERLKRFYDDMLLGKRLLVMSGEQDKMAPWARSAPVIGFLERAVNGEGAWWRKGGMEVRNLVYPGVKHELTMEMVEEATRFVVEGLERDLVIREEGDGEVRERAIKL